MRWQLKGVPQGAKPARGGIRQMGRAKDVTGFGKIGRGAYDNCAGCAKAAGHIQVITCIRVEVNLPEPL